MFLAICTKVHHLFNVFMEIYLWISQIVDLIALPCICFLFEAEEFGGLIQERKKKSLQTDEDGEASLILRCVHLSCTSNATRKHEITPALPQNSTTRYSLGRRKQWSFKDSRWSSLSLGALGEEEYSQSWPWSSRKDVKTQPRCISWEPEETSCPPASGFRLLPLQLCRWPVCAFEQADSATQLVNFSGR